MFFIGLDDTDTLESRGTGHLARQIATDLATEFTVLGVTRHQLLYDPRVPFTAKNSCAAIILATANGATPVQLFERVRALMLADFQVGSDPGLCVVPAASDAMHEITAFGRRVQRELVTQNEARQLAQRHALLLQGLGGTQDGVIGALAATGLAASGDDGRYVQVGRSRELAGLRPISDLLAAGVNSICTRAGQPVTDGLVLADKLRPARRGGQPVAVVEWEDDHWLPLKLD